MLGIIGRFTNVQLHIHACINVTADRMFPFNLQVFRTLTWAQVRDLFRFAVRRLNEERLPQVAGSLTFTTVLALVPVLTIALAIFTAFPLFNTFRAALEAYFIESLMPKAIANTILDYLNQFASQAKRLSAVGAIMLVATAVAMIAMVDRTFHQIWRVKTRRPLMQRILVYWATVTLGPLLIGGSMTFTSFLYTATSDVANQAPILGTVFYTLISVLLTSAAFTLLYMVVPNRLVDWRDAAWGGVVAAIAFEITKRLFVVFVANFPTYTVLYGALAAMPIFLLWIYFGWLITLMGAVLAAALPIVKHERWWHVPKPGSAFVDAMKVLKVLYDARLFDKSAAVNSTLIRAKTRLGFDESEGLLEKMLDAGWVDRIKAESPKRIQFGKRITEGLDRWVLLANPDQLKLADVYRLFVFNASRNATLARQVESAVEQGLNQTIAAHFENDSKIRPVF
jgi:membrane protein